MKHLMLILASQSPDRARLLRRLGHPFETQRPRMDEESLKNTMLAQGLGPSDLCVQLAKAKAESVHDANNENAVIGSDQMLVFEGKIFGKPYTVEKAQEQLRMLSGKTHALLTSVCVLQGKQVHTHLNECLVHFRDLTDVEIQRVIHLDQPLHCAGSYKIESLGISLMRSVQCEDWTAIEGLPLLWLQGCLLQLGFDSKG